MLNGPTKKRKINTTTKLLKLAFFKELPLFFTISTFFYVKPKTSVPTWFKKGSNTNINILEFLNYYFFSIILITLNSPFT